MLIILGIVIYMVYHLGKHQGPPQNFCPYDICYCVLLLLVVRSFDRLTRASALTYWAHLFHRPFAKITQIYLKHSQCFIILQL